MTIEISGQTIYELDPDGVNRWSANVQPGTGLYGYRQPDSVIDRVAKRLYVADLYHERLVEALRNTLRVIDGEDGTYSINRDRKLLAKLESSEGKFHE